MAKKIQKTVKTVKTTDDIIETIDANNTIDTPEDENENFDKIKKEAKGIKIKKEKSSLGKMMNELLSSKTSSKVIIDLLIF